ncbi:hypothetical protein [Winogradskyella sp.]|uniref:hypothetical protein n=1 Tax=Winogradskyella sp. TaxID=1883156 RepID=UPI001B180C88|nr:hypothetical protein [Winogradskyella sp.]MBO6879776.1 hypothetical protein [Winogradskyella sp.]
MTFKKINEILKEYEEDLHFFFKILENHKKFLLNKVEDDPLKYLKWDKKNINFHCFVTSSYIDLLCIYRNLKRSKTNWEKTYNLKLAYLMIYETIKTYHKFKKEIIESLAITDKEIYNGFFRMLNEELLEFKLDFNYDMVISKIRNKTSAHYDKDFLEYYSSFEILNNQDSKNIIIRFFRFMNPLHYFSYSLIKGDVDPLLFVDSWMDSIKY